MADIERFCLCGAAASASGSAVLVGAIGAAFDEVHQGDGHGPATPTQAHAARRRENRAAQKAAAR